MGNGQYYDPSTGRFLTRGSNPNSPNPYLPFDPTGAMLGPLGVLALVLGSKKKKSKYDVLLFVLVFVVASGMTLSACNPPPGNVAATGTATPVAGGIILTGTATVTPLNGAATVTATGTMFVPTNTPYATITLTPCTPTPTSTPIDIDSFITFDGWTPAQKAIAMDAIRKVNEKLLGDASLSKFLQVYNISTSNQLKFIKMSDNGTGCSAGPHLIKCHPLYNLEDPRVIVHELGHVLHQNNLARNLYGDLMISENAIVDDSGRWVTGLHPRGDVCRDNKDPNSNLGIRCAATTVDQYGSFERTFFGYTGEGNPHVYHGRSMDGWNSPSEDFADMFMNWVYITYDYNVGANNAGTKRYDWMDERMSPFIG